MATPRIPLLPQPIAAKAKPNSKGANPLQIPFVLQAAEKVAPKRVPLTPPAPPVSPVTPINKGIRDRVRKPTPIPPIVPKKPKDAPKRPNIKTPY